MTGKFSNRLWQEWVARVVIALLLGAGTYTLNGLEKSIDRLNQGVENLNNNMAVMRERNARDDQRITTLEKMVEGICADIKEYHQTWRK